MQHRTTHHARRNAARAAVASACAAVLPALCASPALAAEPGPRARSAELAVSASVVRGCRLETPALVVAFDQSARAGAAIAVGSEVALTCSQGDAAALEVGPPSARSALYALLARDAAAAPGALGDAREPLVVTVLF